MATTSAELHKSIRSAIKSGDLEKLVDLLAEHSEALEMETPFGSWLHVAAAHGNARIVQYLLDAGIDVNRTGGVSDGTALHRAASNGHIEIVNLLLNRGAKMDTRESKSNPLFGAIVNEHLEVGKLLVEKGIDWGVRYETKTMRGMNALEFAQERGALGFVTFLASLEQ